MSAGPPDADRVRTLREVLTATGAGIYLATHVAGPLPAESLAAVHESDDLELRIGRVGPDREEDLELREWEARAAVAATIKASFERVILAHGAADAARSVALEVLGAPAQEPGARLEVLGAPSGPVGARAQGAGRVLLVEGLDEHVAAAIASVARAVGAAVDEVPSVPEIVGTDVRLVAMAHVDPLGRLSDPAAAAAAAHRAGARLLLDASLSAGALALDVAELGVDAVVADVQRWLLGPEGLAFAWLAPTLGETTPGRCRATIGPFPRGALLALARSVGWLLMYVDLPWVVARTGRLARRLHGSLGTIPGVELLVERAHHAALLAFRIAGWDAEQAVEELSRSAFVIADASRPSDAIRASVGAWNREDELDRFVERVAELAAHSPATLPRRPSLTIISGPAGER